MAAAEFLTTKPPLAPTGHDDGVLHRLRLDQAEDLGAEVLAAVRPPQAAAGDEPEPQVHALDARRVDEDLEPRPRQRQFVDQPGVELDRQHVLLPGRIRPADKVIGPQRRLNHRGECAQHPVGVEAYQGIDVGGHRGGGGLRVPASASDRGLGSNSASNSSTIDRAVPALPLITVSM